MNVYEVSDFSVKGMRFNYCFTVLAALHLGLHCRQAERQAGLRGGELQAGIIMAHSDRISRLMIADER